MLFDTTEETIFVYDTVFNSFCSLEEGNSEEDSQSKENRPIKLHQYTNVLLDVVCVKFVQLIRQAQISKTSANQLLSVVKSLLPFPNSLPPNMNNLLTRSNVVNYFQRRKSCLLCGKSLQGSPSKCNICLTVEAKHVAYILDTDISSLLTKVPEVQKSSR